MVHSPASPASISPGIQRLVGLWLHSVWVFFFFPCHNACFSWKANKLAKHHCTQLWLWMTNQPYYRIQTEVTDVAQLKSLILKPHRGSFCPPYGMRAESLLCSLYNKHEHAISMAVSLRLTVWQWSNSWAMIFNSGFGSVQKWIWIGWTSLHALLAVSKQAVTATIKIVAAWIGLDADMQFMSLNRFHCATM